MNLMTSFSEPFLEDSIFGGHISNSNSDFERLKYLLKEACIELGHAFLF